MQGKGRVPWGSYCNTKADDLNVYVAKRQQIAVAVCHACSPAVKDEMKKLLKKMKTTASNMDVA
jgi:hypothetical protein